jgi:pyruvate kinase
MLDKKIMQSALEDIEILRTHLLQARKEIAAAHPRTRSLLNLKQYLILRKNDRTELQEKLFMLSLSSLGRSFAHVAASIDTLHDQLSSSLGYKEISEELMAEFHHLPIHDAIAIASQNSKLLFGGKTSSKLSKQSTAVMVTLPSDAVQNDGILIRQLAETGINVFRINTAHDDAATWKAMADIIVAINEQRDSADTIKIFVDLAGPKIRTGKIRKVDYPIAIGSKKQEKEVVITIRDGMTKGEEVDSVTLEKNPAQITVEKKFFKNFTKNRAIKIVDANGKKASIKIYELADTYAKGVINKKIFVNKKTKLFCNRHKGSILNIDTQIEAIRLFVDDLLIITETEVLGRAALLNMEQKVIEPALISCSLHNMLSHIQAGEKVFIDDGKIGLEVIKKNVDSITCRVTHSKSNGTFIKEEKGINFPDTYIRTKALTETDRVNLLSVLDFADHLSLSFCQSAEDVHDLQKILSELGRSDIGIIAKIETKQGVINMPIILEQLLASEKSGVMIARGDLAIEVGFENMPHIQEAILDICDAAHLPVIWATQVLESMMKNNLPSRAEVTDAAMAGRAECVMLNKGAFAIDTIDTLTRILDDMHSISKKNRHLLKKETLWY